MSKELNINSKIFIPKNKQFTNNENDISKTNFSDNEDIFDDSEYLNNLKYKNIFYFILMIQVIIFQEQIQSLKIIRNKIIINFLLIYLMFLNQDYMNILIVILLNL